MMIPQYKAQLTGTRRRTRELLTAIKHLPEFKRLDAKALSNRDSVYGLECVIREIHTVAMMNKVGLPR